ncbi:MAG: glycosyltransferase [Hungatella sp.]|nr:glycosyltransferase [Hungatella sp.]
MWKPLVSVIIPVYNGSNYLKEAIDSVLNQTYPDIEIIVVNDGSDDFGQTEEIALSYGQKVRYYYKENGGVSTALNVGIRQMKGRYFSWLSHDDVFYPEKIQKQVCLLEQEKTRVTACSYNIFYDSGRHIPVPVVDFYGIQMLRKGAFGILNSLLQFGGVLFKREIFDAYGVFREDLKTTQDYEFLFRVLRKEKCAYSNEILYGIRYHDNQGSNTINCVDKERDEMYQMFLQELSDDEKVYMYGSVYNFYYQMLLRLWPLPNISKSVKLCVSKLKTEKGSEDQQKTKSSDSVLIYGAGAYGRRLLFDLRCRGMKVAGFVDGNSNLWGNRIDGMNCYSLEEVMTGKITGTIIIASIFREEIAAVLKENGFSDFYFKEEWDRRMFGMAPGRGRIEEVIASYGEK